MPPDKSNRARGGNNAVARGIHEITYWKHCTGASESQIRAVIARVGNNREKIERELKRVVSGSYYLQNDDLKFTNDRRPLYN